MGKVKLRGFFGDSEDAALWVSHVEKKCDAEDLNKATRLRYDVAHLRGQAEMWLQRRGASWESWTKLTKALISRFIPADFEEQQKDSMRTAE